MHIPDGFLSPQTYLPAYALAAVAWGWAARGMRATLDETTVPRLAMLTALAYALGLIMLPVPGGSSGHALGVAILALVFGVRAAFVAYSLVLLLQSLFFGAGGITALALNALAMGLAGAVTAVGVKQVCTRLFEPVWGARGEAGAIAFAAWASVVVPAALVALALGVQPHIAHRPDGAPLFFPFDLSITLPAVLIPHSLIGLGEAALTVFVLRYAKARQWPAV